MTTRPGMEALLVLTKEDSRMFRPELLSTSTHTLILTVFESFYKRFSCAVFPYLYWRYLDST